MPPLAVESLDPHLAEAFAIASACVACAAEVLQRVALLAADLVLIILACVALRQDWLRLCDETLHLYAFLCIVLCLMDAGWESVRCSMESQLDQLQEDFKPQTSSALADEVSEGLLGDEEGCDYLANDTRDARPPLVERSSSFGGYGIRREKALKRKRTADLQFWSVVFSCFVSVIFSFFSEHDEECAVQVPHLYNYLRTFTYVVALRMGCMITLVCCRTVKNYEDAAHAAGGDCRGRDRRLEPL